MRRAAVGAGAALLLAAGAAIASTASVPRLDVEQERPRHRGPDSARVALFLDALGAADPVVCEFVSDQLGNFWFGGDEYGIGRLADARSAAREAKDSVSRRVTDAAAIRLLTSRLEAENPCARLVAAKMLGNSTITDAQYERLLESRSARVREAALRGTGVRERPALRGAIERQMDASEPQVAVMAVYALGQLEDRAAVPRLRRALQSSQVQMRVTAAWALGMIEDPAPAAELEDLARRDPERRVRLAAIYALGDIEARRSFAPLVALLEDPDLSIATAAAEALGSLDAPAAAPPALLRAAQSTHGPLKYAALEVLTRFEDPAVVPVLLANITDPNPDVRTQLIEALGELKAASAVPAIRRALTDPVAEVRRAAVEALAEIADH